MESSSEESPLEMARRHVRMGEQHVARQKQIITDLIAAGHDVSLAQKTLAAQEEFLSVAMGRVALLEAKKK